MANDTESTNRALLERDNAQPSARATSKTAKLALSMWHIDHCVMVSNTKFVKMIAQSMELYRYIYLMGINPARRIDLDTNVILEPASCNPSGDEIVEITTNRGDCSELSLALAAATLRRTYAQLRIGGNDEKGIAIDTWNSQWWCVALSAYLNTQVAFFFESDQPLQSVADSYRLHSIIGNLLPMPSDCIYLDEETCKEIESAASSIKSLMQNERFSLAISSLWGVSFHPRPSIRMATVWVGIESLFPFSWEKRKRLSRAIPDYLNGTVSADFVKGLWDARNECVHEGKLSRANALEDSCNLLNMILHQCIDNEAVPERT